MMTTPERKGVNARFLVPFPARFPLPFAVGGEC